MTVADLAHWLTQCLVIALYAISLHTIVREREACHGPVSACVKHVTAVSMLTHWSTQGSHESGDTHRD